MRITSAPRRYTGMLYYDFPFLQMTFQNLQCSVVKQMNLEVSSEKSMLSKGG